MEKIRELWESYRTQIMVILLVIIGLVAVVSQHVGGLYSRNATVPAAVSASLTTTGSATMNAQPQRICVDVKGAVKRPGIYYFKRGARVVEALRSAGGQLPTADMKDVNLAKELMDQQVIYVPVIGEQSPAISGESSANAGAEKATVNINTASKDQLCQITGIGDKKADLIIAYRQEHGQFKTVDELTQVSGFGEKTVAKIKDQLAV